MKFKLILENGDDLVYDPYTSEISVEIPQDRLKYSYNTDFYKNVEYTADPNKMEMDTVKLLFGTNCNYHCKYCNQQEVRELVPSKQDLETAYHVIDKLASDYTIKSHIELWGGEPFVYWKTIQKLVPYIRKYFAKVPITCITNGSLLDEEKAHFCNEYGITIVISHDGPAQVYTRHDPDILADKTFQKAFAILTSTPTFGSFHFVISKYNCDLFKTVDWFDNNVFPGVPVSTEGVVGVFSYNKQYFPPFTTQEQGTLIECFNQMARIDDPRYFFVHSYVSSFINKLNRNPPVYKYGCNDPDEKVMSIDLKGNLLACHAEPCNIALGLGNILRKPNFKRKSEAFIGWEKRKNCRDCIGLSICHGGCGIISQAEHDTYCPNRWLQSVATISGAMGKLFDTRLVSIEKV